MSEQTRQQVIAAAWALINDPQAISSLAARATILRLLMAMAEDTHWPAPRLQDRQVWFHPTPMAGWNRQNSPDRNTPGYWQFNTSGALPGMAELTTATQANALRHWARCRG